MTLTKPRTKGSVAQELPELAIPIDALLCGLRRRDPTQMIDFIYRRDGDDIAYYNSAIVCAVAALRTSVDPRQRRFRRRTRALQFR
jgi:hypothetical protein